MRKSSVIEELLPFGHLNINDFVHSEPLPSNQWMEFHETYSYDISGNGIVMHIKIVTILSRSLCPFIAYISMNAPLKSLNLVRNRLISLKLN